MKKRILAFLLAGCMLLQCSFSVAAEKILAEDSVDIVMEEETTPIIEETDVLQKDETESGPGEVILYGAESSEENVAAGTLLDFNISWEKDAGDKYWDDIEWSKVEWAALSGSANDPTMKLPNGWGSKVDWSKVDWNMIDWFGYSEPPSSEYWKEIAWDKVNWGNMVWSKVVWSAIKGLETEGKIELSFTYDTDDTQQITTPVLNKANTKYGDYIASSCVTIKVKGEGVTGEGTVIPGTAYIITVGQQIDNYELKGIWNSTHPNKFFASEDFFSGRMSVPSVVHGTVRQPLTNAEYWTISVDDTDCSFANTQTKLPKVTIQSSDGSVTLDEGTDFEIRDVTGEGKFLCGKHELEITAKDDSEKVAPGTVREDFTVHYVDIKDFYTLEGVPQKIIISDQLPKLTMSNSELERKTEDQLKGYLYLKPKEDAIFEGGELPIANDQGYGVELWNSKNFLMVEYRYDSESPETSVWSSTFDWSKWREKKGANIVNVRISVNENGKEAGKYDPLGGGGTGDVPYRYLKGNISASMRVIPYSLAEVNENEWPKTNPFPGGGNDFAVVNPVTTPREGAPDGYFDSVTDGSIPSVIYNGSPQRPNPDISCSVFTYNGSYYWENIDWRNYSTSTTTYTENVNAGIGIIEISFDGEYTGSIIREFEIKPKDISDVTDKSITIQAQDFLYDGNPHAPILAIFDSQANTVLRKGVDYTVTTTSNITSPGTVTATIEGKNNYTGTRTVQYKIVSTSVTVTGTKLEQVANIPDKIDGQKYTGQPVTPEVVITGKNPSMKLVKDRDYKVSYLNNIESGTAYAVVEGIGNYGGTYIIPFVIGERLSQKIVVLPAQERDLKKRTLFSKSTVVKYTESPKTDTTYTSSNPNIVKVDAKTGAIEYKGIGTAVITINAAASDIYNAAIKELTVKVLPRTPKDVAVRFVAGKGIAVTGSAVPEASKYQLRIQKSGHRSVFVNIDNIGALDTAYQTKSKGKFNVWVRAYKTVNGVKHFSGWTSKRTVIVK